MDRQEYSVEVPRGRFVEIIKSSLYHLPLYIYILLELAGLNEMRSTVSGMDLNLELLADRVTNLELKLNKVIKIYFIHNKLFC